MSCLTLLCVLLCKNPAKKSKYFNFFSPLPSHFASNGGFFVLDLGQLPWSSFFHGSKPVTILAPLIIQEAKKLQQGEAALTYTFL